MAGYIYKPRGETFIECTVRNGERILNCLVDTDTAKIGNNIELYHLEDLTIETWEIISFGDLKNDC